MRELLDFFKDILMIKEDNRLNIGLTQFKKHKQEIKTTKTIKANNKKELKLSDLMRGSIS